MTEIQPEFSFRRTQYEGAVNYFRLCSAGYGAAGQGQAADYELSSEGNSPMEEERAHQHLAVVQFTGGIRQFPGIFAGQWPNSRCGGRSAGIGSVNLITHADQMAGAIGPTATANPRCERASGHRALSEPALARFSARLRRSLAA